MITTHKALLFSPQTGWDAPASAVLGLVARVPLADHSNLSLAYSQRAGELPGCRWA